MIAGLTGTLVSTDFTKIIIDVNGVGYEVLIPMSTYDKLPQINSAVTLKILTVVREDSITLYGFYTTDEKSLFVLLNSVSGIGPKLALNILSALPVSHICALISESNITALSKINGLGKKTAERLSVELRDKVAVFEYVEAKEEQTQIDVLSSDAEDAIAALTTLGYKIPAAKKIIIKLLKSIPEAEQNAANLIRKALQAMNS